MLKDRRTDPVAMEWAVAHRAGERPRALQIEMKVVLRCVSDGTVALQRGPGRHQRGLVGLAFRHAGVYGIERRGGAVDERAGELEGDPCVREVMLDRLERADRDPELPALLRVPGGHVEHALREAALLGCSTDDSAVEGGREHV